MAESVKKKVKNKDARLRSSNYDNAYAGNHGPLPSNVLPTFQEVGLAVEFLKVSGMSESAAITQVSQDVVNVYDHASVPTINPKKIREKVKNFALLRKKRLKEFVINKKKGTPMVQGKRRVSHKNGKEKIKLQDVL